MLSLEIKRIYRESFNTYGIRRIKEQLDKDSFNCGKNRVLRLMKENNVESKLKRKYKA
ncbi:IS3 family transposase [Clostridium perfringens]